MKNSHNAKNIDNSVSIIPASWLICDYPGTIIHLSNLSQVLRMLIYKEKFSVHYEILTPDKKLLAKLFLLVSQVIIDLCRQINRYFPDFYIPQYPILLHIQSRANA
jgi:hypothetical protein